MASEVETSIHTALSPPVEELPAIAPERCNAMLTIAGAGTPYSAFLDHLHTGPDVLPMNLRTCFGYEALELVRVAHYPGGRG